MHVAHLLRKYVPAEWGGTETALHRLIEGLARHGVQSTVYCPAPLSSAPPVTTDPLAEAGGRVERFRNRYGKTAAK